MVRRFRSILAIGFLGSLVVGMSQARAEPRPGDVYREYAQDQRGNIAWRVTDPNARPEGAKKFLPNPVLHIAVDDLQGAVRAEAVVDRWGGHPKTARKQIRFNGNPWITLPELKNTPDGSRPEKFLSQDNPEVEIPLKDLKQGDNTFEGTCGTIENFNWGQWGLYAIIVRVYYDPKLKPHATGRIAAPSNGQSLGENPAVTLEAGADAQVARVDFLACYEGFDEDGDGVYRQWHQSYHKPERDVAVGITDHVGTVTHAPYQTTWNTRWVPDQPPGSMELIARVQDKGGLWYVTEPVRGLSLDRTDCSVKLYRARGVSESFGVRMGKTNSCRIEIPAGDDLSKAVEACVSLRTWNGYDEIHSPWRLNDWSSKIGGKNHHYAYNLHEVPVSALEPGVNTIQFHSDFKEHALEVLWPGPTLAVRYETQPSQAESLPPLRVSDNGRFLVTKEGRPFFWLGDTAWGLISKARREDGPEQPVVAKYFEARETQGFNVLQTVAIRWGKGGPDANVYGQQPFVDGDWTRPKLADGPDNDYWDWVDYVVDLAASRHIYVALLPTWLNGVPEKHPLVEDPSVAYCFGRFLGDRYRDRTNLIWVMGGDPYTPSRDVENPKRLAMTRAMAEGIADGTRRVDAFDGRADYSTTLMTYHPKGGGHSSSERLHQEPWLDFNMIQTTTRFEFANYETVAKDYEKSPPKPTLDGEVAYEGSLSLRKNEPQDRRTRPWEARRAAYWAVFAGAFGHTYGHRSFIGWVRKGETEKHGANIPWYESLDAPGAGQMKHLRRLMESRPFLVRVPEQSLIVGKPGTGYDHAQATRGSDGSYALVYLPTGKEVTVNLAKLSGERVRASWYDPRTGKSQPIGDFARTGEKRFVPPTHGEENDWVLVLDGIPVQTKR